MGFKEDRRTRVLRWIKTLFFLISMLISLLLFSAPILLVIADTLLPSALLSASLSPSSLSIQTLSSHLSNYDFRYSLVDIPLISIIRSALILLRNSYLNVLGLRHSSCQWRSFSHGVYSLCDGPRLSRGPYLGIATMCSISSLVFLSLKASYVFGNSSRMDREGYVRVMEMALFVCSFALAVAHVVVAYRISCRERRKLLLYKIDIEAIYPKENCSLVGQGITITNKD